MGTWDLLPELLDRLQTALKHKPIEFDRGEVQALVDKLVERFRQSCDELIPAGHAVRALQLLRGQREFLRMQKLGEALVQSGVDSPRICTLYAQALLDDGKLSVAEPLLEQVVAQAITVEGRSEGHGLLGRLFKQRYVADRSRNLERRAGFLRRSVAEYSAGMKLEIDLLWHGINLVAMAARGARDGIELSSVGDLEQLARDLIDKSRLVTKPNAWTAAACMEANVALNSWDQALQEAREYLAGGPDTFALAGTLRQMREVWQLSPSDRGGGFHELIALLSAETLCRNQGELQLASSDVSALQRNFDNEPGQAVAWMRTGLNRCDAIARIQTEAGVAIGTGFLVDRAALSLGPEGSAPLLLTCWHVVSEGGGFPNSIPPSAAIAVFEILKEQRRITGIAAHCRALDASFLELAAPLDPKFAPCPSKPDPEPFRGAVEPPQRSTSSATPRAGGLTFSLHDSVWLDADVDRLHYRTATDPGSSGSPVFDRANWVLLALHHAGSRTMNRLNGRVGTYEAYEGLAIRSIGNAVAANPKT